MLNVDVRSKVLLGALAGASLFALVGAAQAQVAPADDQSQADIVVTAKSRTEKLQDVPLSITALTTSALQDNQVRDVKDLQKITPNLSLFSGSGRNDPSGWAMRGLTSNTSDERYQGISFFLDGIALSGQLASIDIDNIERVEVIKGPQAATFGRATYSGAVNFITKEPTGDTITGSIRARTSIFKGSNEPSYFVNGSITAPIIKDQLWLSVAGSTFRNGKVANAVDSGQAIGREKSDIVTATLFWKPDDTLSIRLRGLYTHDFDSIAAQVVEQPREWAAQGIPTTQLPRGYTAGVPFAIRSSLPTYLPDPSLDNVADKGRGGYKRNRYFVSLITEKKFGDYQLSYRGGWFKSEDTRDAPSYPGVLPTTPDPITGSIATRTTSFGAFTTSSEVFVNTSHQLVLLSPGDKPFRWRVGGYYFWERDTSRFASFATALTPSGLATVQSFENIAGFAGFDWDFASGLTLSGEGRYARETLKYPPCINCVPSQNTLDFSRSSNDFSPRVTLSYKVAPDHMVYALYSNGVKSGRFSNVTPVGGTQTIIYAQPEKLDNFEVGTKNAFWNGRAIINLSGFFDKVRQQQLTSTTQYTFVNAAGQTVNSNITATNNVGKSEIWGFELETHFKVAPRFTVDGSIGYAKQKFVNTNPVVLSASSVIGFPGAPGDPVVLSGKTQANVPWWNGYVAGQYVVPLDNGASLKFRADASYRGKLYADLANLTAIKPAWTVNSRITLARDDWDVSLFGRNLFNNQRATGSGLAGATTLCGYTESATAVYGNAANQQCLFASPPRPLEVGVEFAFKF